MKNYIVIKHDCRGLASINYTNGYHVTLATTEGFRAVPVTAIIWTATVTAKTKTQAIALAKAQHRGL